MSLFTDASIEAAHWAMHGTLCDLNENAGHHEPIQGEEEDVVRGMLVAAVAALDTDTLIEKAAKALGHGELHDEGWTRCDRAARDVFTAIGLLPEAPAR